MFLYQWRSKLSGLVDEQIVRPAHRFFEKEATSSLLLLAAAIAAIWWANSAFSEYYHRFWHTHIAFSMGGIHIEKSLVHWINDGLMALFFFTVGLEIKREVLVGELSSFRKALLPVIAAAGGMLVPAAIYLAFTLGTPHAQGWGIPMATDIAFALGAVAVFGKSLPVSLRVFLAAFAIADDIGAVIVIALFYTEAIVWSNLLVCLGFMALLAFANAIWIQKTLVFALLGIGVWLSVLGSGVHATVAGVIVAMFIPARGKLDTDRFLRNIRRRLEAFECEEQSCGYSILLNENHLNAVQAIKMDCHQVETPLQQLEHALHPWVAFVILPLFAFGNAGLQLGGTALGEMFFHPVNLGIMLGLVAGKPLGIFLFSYGAARLGLVSLPGGIGWSHVLGVSMLGGIGFTMSLFISDLSFSTPDMLNYAKLGVFTGSILSGLMGMGFLFYYATKRRQKPGFEK